MAQVIDTTEIELNGTKFKLSQPMQQFLLSNFAPKMVIGDYTADSNPELSGYAMGDFTGGLLAENVNSPEHNQYWWSNCITDYKGHVLLPRGYDAATVTAPTLPTIVNAGFESALGAEWTESLSGAGAATGRQTSGQRTGTACLNTTSGVGYGKRIQTIAIDASLVGKTLMLQAYVNTTVAAYTTLTLADSTGATAHSHPVGTGAYEKVSVGLTIAAGATSITITCWTDYDGLVSVVALWDDVTISAKTSSGYGFCNFNNNLYMYDGNYIYKLNTGTGAAFTYVGCVSANITDMVASLNNCMYIACGDSVNYWVMTAAEVMTQNVTAAYWFLQWDGKLNKFTSADVGSYSSDPNAASPTWTALGIPTDINTGDYRKPVVYQDLEGNDVLMIATPQVLKVYDTTTTTWVDTQLNNMPDHPYGAYGCIAWRGSLYIGSGLNVIKYTNGLPAIIESVGLDEQDSIPNDYNSNIRLFVSGFNRLFAIANLASGGYIFAYDGKTWKAWASIGQYETGSIVSSAYNYRLWWNVNGSVYYMTIPQGTSNPTQITSFSHAGAGVLYNSWFDGFWKAGSKNAIQLRVATKGCTANKTVTCKYRINKTNVDLSTGWTTLTNATYGSGAITADGETTFSFGSGAGILFRQIQFEFDLSNNSTSGSPDLLYATLEYTKVIPPTWGFIGVVDCSGDYYGKTASQLVSALETAATTQTLVTFVYNNTTYYVRVKDVSSKTETGLLPAGMYQVTLVKPV